MSSKYSPEHYQSGSIEVWDFIADQQLDYFSGNIIKYLCRAGKKESETQLDDLLKAQAYLRKLVTITIEDYEERLNSKDGPSTELA